MSFYYWDQMRVATVGTKEQPFLENSRVPRYPQNEEWVPKNNPKKFLASLVPLTTMIMFLSDHDFVIENRPIFS